MNKEKRLATPIPFDIVLTISSALQPVALSPLSSIQVVVWFASAVWRHLVNAAWHFWLIIDSVVTHASCVSQHASYASHGFTPGQPV